MLKSRSVEKVDNRIKELIKYLDLNESNVHSLKYRKVSTFEPEVDCCHLNVWVQIQHSGGQPVFGWKFGEDKKYDFAEANFHSVWKSPDGQLQDITPRLENEKRILFVEDKMRQIVLTNRGCIPLIKSFDNVRMMSGRILSPLNPILIRTQSEMLVKYNLIETW